MKLFRKFLILFSSFFRRFRSELRSLKRQIPDLLMHGWPKYIIVASKADADACAAPMAFLLAKNLKVDQVWWRHVRHVRNDQANKLYTPRGFEHFIQRAYFDVGGQFDGEIVDGKLVKPGKLFFDHHHDKSFLNHCATSLVIESFGLKDPVLSFLGEYVRRVDTGNPGGAAEMLRGNARGRDALGQIITLSRFFEVIGEPEMLTIIDQVGQSISDLRVIVQSVKDYERDEYFNHLHECDKFLKAMYANDWDYVAANVTSAKASAKAVVTKLCDADFLTDEKLYLAVYGIQKSNAAILGAMSALVNGLKNDISYSEQIRKGCLDFKSFYNQESLRQKIIRDTLPGGKFKHLKVKNSSGNVARILVAENTTYDGTALRVVTRQSFYESVDLVICGSPNDAFGLILVDPKRREVLSLKHFRNALVAKYPAHAPSFLHPNEFVLYVKTVDGAKDKDKISFTDLVALAKELIEESKAEKPLPDPLDIKTQAKLVAIVESVLTL